MGKVLSFIKNISLAKWLSLASGIIALVVMIMGATSQALALNTNFSAITIVVMILSVLFAITTLFVKFTFWTLLTSACHFVAFGLILNSGVPVIADKLNNITFQGGNFTLVLVYLIMLGIAIVLSIVSNFLPFDNTGKQNN